MTRPHEFPRGSIAAVAATLPPTARSLYFRDEIGNISSSGGCGCQGHGGVSEMEPISTCDIGWQASIEV
jgi:hypothetical protein